MFPDSDNVGGRTFSSASYAGTGMTVESCISFCSTGANSYIYAGVEYADECCELNEFFSGAWLTLADCGNSFAAGSTSVSLSQCNMPCSGNSAEFCGAGNLLNVYWSGAQPPSGPITVPSVGNWVSLGCYR